MAKKIRFPLKMKNGAEVRTLDELKENFDLESVLGYFADGKLAKWLADRYYDEKAEAVTALTSTTPNLSVKLCEILEVEYQAENGNIDLESIKRHNKKYQLLSAITSKKEILHNIDIVAINQDDLYAILYDSPSLVYLYGEEFVAPIGAENVEYIGVNNPLVKLNKGKTILDYNEKGVRFKDVRFDFDVINYGETLFITGKLKEAFPVLKNAANNGNSRAMYLMAQYYSYGYDTVIIDEKERNNWYEKGYNLKDPASMYGYATYCIEYNSAEQKSVYNRIFNDIRNMAESGDVIASNVLGTMYKLGRGVEQNSVEAAKWYMVGAEQGYVNSQSSLGNLYYFGNGVDKDSEEAVKWYKKAAEQGNANALFNLGCFFKDGLADQVPDILKAISLFEKVGEQGYSKGYLVLGEIYYNGKSIPKDEVKAVDFYKKASELGNINADFYLGKMYVFGNGVEQNFDEADKHFELYADRSWDCFRIGEIYEKADKSYEKASKWYTKAAEYNDPDTDALIALGRIEDTVNYDYYEAAKWYQKAVNQKAKSAYEIGYLYDEGEKVPQDYSKAVEWYRKGVELEDADSYKSLGRMYYYGHGVECDKDKANELCSKSIELFTKIYEETKIAVEKGEKDESALSWAEMHLNMAKMSISSMGFEEKVQEIADGFEAIFDSFKPVSIIDKYIHSCIKSGSASAKAYDSNEIRSVSNKVERAKKKFGYRATGNIIGLIDWSLFGNGNDGILFTDEGFAFDLAFKKIFVRYDEITSIEYGKKCKSITLNGYFKNTNNCIPELSDIFLNLDIVKTMLEKLKDCS